MNGVSAPMKLAYTYAEAASACGVSEKVIQRAVQCGDLVPRYPTSRPVLLVDDLRGWLESAPTQRRAS